LRTEEYYKPSWGAGSNFCDALSGGIPDTDTVTNTSSLSVQFLHWENSCPLITCLLYK